MAFQRCLSQEMKTTPNAVTETENTNGCFDCNICLDFANDPVPVVTLCGHLYCWPCIYKWLHVQSDSLGADEHPPCPVCKVAISNSTMVPLYGRGQAPPGGKTSCCETFTPPRPTASGAQALMATASQSGQQLQYRNQGQYFSPPLYQGDGATSQMLNLGASMGAGSHHSVVGMFGEMVFARVFGNPENLYAYPNSYQLMGNNRSRSRRQEFQTDKFLNRISIFLFFCFVLCLMFF